MAKIWKKTLTSIVFILLTLCLWAGIAVAPKRAVADGGSFTLEKTTFEEGEAITVTANGTGAEATAFPTEGVTIAQNEFVDIYVTVSVVNSVNAQTTADFVFKFIAENTTTP